MPNKVKDIFSDNMFNINGTFRFSDNEAYKNFLTAMEISYVEGRVVPVEGVTSVTAKIDHLGTQFPLEEHTNITHFLIGPAVEPVPITLNIDGEEKTITLLRSQAKDKVILKSEPESIIAFTFTFFPNEKKYTINYKVQFEKAKNVYELADSFSLAAALLSIFHLHEKEKYPGKDDVSLPAIKRYFHHYGAFFKRLHAIEKILGLSISANLLNNLSPKEQQDIDELYLILCKKQVVRLNAKLTSTNSTSIAINHKSHNFGIGNKFSLTFLSTIKYNFLEQTIVLYTANLLVNALVKDIQEDSDGTVKILYGDTDSKPMYISFSAFKTEKEAKQETDSIMQHSAIYINALTINQYIKQFYL